MQDRRDAALADARRAVELSPDSAAARIALSYAQQATFQLEAARATLREAVEIAPEDALAWARLSELELSFGELRAAPRRPTGRSRWRRSSAARRWCWALPTSPGSTSARPRAAFERAIALDTADPLPRLGLGLAMIRESDLEAGPQRDRDRGRHSIPTTRCSAAISARRTSRRSATGRPASSTRSPSSSTRTTPRPGSTTRSCKQTRGPAGRGAARTCKRSIELNDNRAVYRSRLLLDSDRAARGTSLALIYDDLGFLQPGINEASRSLTFDPANAGAHRFLSDIYVGVRRREIARVSKLLQAQMLQDININPVQPSLSEPNLNLVTQGGPAEAGFNEFTPLFERNEANLNVTGVAGNENTYGGEGVVSALYDRYSVSAGAFGYRTDGWRENNDIKQDVQDVFFPGGDHARAQRPGRVPPPPLRTRRPRVQLRP